MNQRDEILRHLKRGHGLTAMDALKYWGCMRLAARIEELRDMGHDIHTVMVKKGGKRYARYRLIRNRSKWAA
jgi:hypothetical protein